MVVITINIVNPLLIPELVMGIIMLTIPEVAKITINHLVKAVTDKTVTVAAILVTAVVEVTEEEEEEVMVMEEAVTVVVVDTIVATLVEDMAEAKVEEEVDMGIVEDMETALVEDTTVAVAEVVITKGATVTATVVVMEWSCKKIPFSCLEWIHLFQKTKFVNILELLD